jgi:hypothetical protein
MFYLYKMRQSQFMATIYLLESYSYKYQELRMASGRIFVKKPSFDRFLSSSLFIDK